MPSPHHRTTNRYAQMFDVEDTCDDTSLASHISEDSITSAPEGYEKSYEGYTKHANEEEKYTHNRRFSTHVRRCSYDFPVNLSIPHK